MEHGKQNKEIIELPPRQAIMRSELQADKIATWLPRNYIDLAICSKVCFTVTEH